MMKHNQIQHLQYLTMLDKNATNWVVAVRGRGTYSSSAGWRLLTGLWKHDSVRMTEAYGYIRELMGTNSQRAFVLGAIRDGLIECEDKELENQLRGSTNTSSSEETRNRRGLSSPNVWLSDGTRKAIDSYFDEAVAELLRTADSIKAESKNKVI